MTDAPASETIRAAASIVVWRGSPGDAEVLMGRRGTKAAFMPSKFVFPGGAVDPGDARTLLHGALPSICARRLAVGGADPKTLAVAAIRELWEETGLALGSRASGRSDVGERMPDAKASGIAPALGFAPDAGGLSFVFRAITPPGGTRRFDARFFLVAASRVEGDPDDFSAASDELSGLRWIALSRARSLDLPFITEVVLAEVAHRLRYGRPDAGVPFFDNSGAVPTFRRLA